MKKILIITVIIAILISAASGFIVAVASKLALIEIFMSLSPSTPFMPETNILVLGIDNTFGHRSDTIILLHTNPKTKSASLVSIPRDTLALLPGRGLDKVNHAFAYGGIELTVKTVEKLLDVEIPYYMLVDLSGIISIIDQLGGISIDVEKRMYYVDYAGDLHIDLKPGRQKLNGKQIMGYLRYRRDGGDFKRIARQQSFLKSLASEMMKRDNLIRSPKLFFSLLSHVNTNLSSKQVLGVALGLRTAHELGKVYMTTVPGTDLMVDGIYYWKPDLERMKNIVKKIIFNREEIS